MTYFLYGLDFYRIKEKERELVSQFLAGDENNINLEKIEGEELTLGRFEQAISAVSFFSREKVVVIRNFLLENKDSELKAKIADRLKNSGQIKLIFVEYGQPDKREKIFKVLTKSKSHSRPRIKYGASSDRESTNILSADPWVKPGDDKIINQYFGLLSDYELKQWIIDIVKKHDFIIERIAIDALALSVGADLWRLTNEIEKLVLYAGSQNRQQIEIDDIKLMVESEYNPNVFHFIEALAGGDKKISVTLLQQFLNNGENENYLLSMIIYQFRTLIIIKDLLERGISISKIASEAKISPYVIEKCLPLAKKYPLEELKNFYQQLYQFDIKIKTGLLQSRVAIDLLVAG